MTSRKINYSTITVENENGMTYILTYRIIIDETDLGSGMIENYGIEIEMNTAETIRMNEVRGITVNNEKIERIALSLSGGAVFPDDLYETLDNILE